MSAERVPDYGAQGGALTELAFRIRDFTENFEDADRIVGFCIAYADSRDAAALAEARAQTRTMAMEAMGRDCGHELVEGGLRAQIAALEAANEVMRAIHPASEWHEDYGDVLWHSPDEYGRICEPPVVASPNSSDWDEEEMAAYTHWSRIPRVDDPGSSAALAQSDAGR